MDIKTAEIKQSQGLQNHLACSDVMAGAAFVRRCWAAERIASGSASLFSAPARTSAGSSQKQYLRGTHANNIIGRH